MKFQGNLLEVLKVWLLKVEANVKLLHNWNTIISNYTGVFHYDTVIHGYLTNNIIVSNL